VSGAELCGLVVEERFTFFITSVPSGAIKGWSESVSGQITMQSREERPNTPLQTPQIFAFFLIPPKNSRKHPSCENEYGKEQIAASTKQPDRRNSS